MSNIQSKVLNIAFHFQKNEIHLASSYHMNNRKLQRENDDVQTRFFSKFYVNKFIFICRFLSYVQNSFVCGTKKDVRQKKIFLNTNYSIFSTRLCKNPHTSKFKNLVRMNKN